MTTDSNRAVTDLIGGLTSLSRDAAAMDAATVNIYRALLDDAVRAAALAQVERDDAIAKVDAADQRARSLDAALTNEREAGRGLVAQVERMTSDGATWRDLVDAVEQARDMAEAARDAHAAELRAIRDLVAPGNPQGTVVDAVRTTMRALGLVREDRDRASALAANRTAACDRADAEIAKLRAELAELRARPVLTVEALAGAVDASIALSRSEGGARKVAESIMAKLGPVTLPSPDRAEELIRSILSERRALMRGLGATLDDKLSDAWAAEWIDATRTALAKLSPAPAREAAPTLVAVSDEELRDAYLNDPDGTLSGIRAVRAKLGAAEVTEERLAAAIREAYGHAAPEFVRAALNHLRATAAKGG